VVALLGSNAMDSPLARVALLRQNGCNGIELVAGFLNLPKQLY
jgi:hypothetical protein